MCSFNVCITWYSFWFILYNLIVLSLEQETNSPEFNCITHLTLPLCSLIIKSGLNVLLLYIIIDLSFEPVTNLPSFNTVEQYTQLVWYLSVSLGSLSPTIKLSYIFIHIFIFI